MSVVLKLRVTGTERVLRGQEHFWGVMRTLHAAGQGITAEAVFSVSNEPHRATISTYMRRLEQAGFLEKTGETAITYPGRQSAVYRIARIQTAAPRVGRDGTASLQGRAQQNMWNVMRRQHGGWTAQTLAVDASTDDVRVRPASALAYCSRLASAGVLLVSARGGPGTPQRWRLKGSANTGPKPPMILRSKMVYDQNTGAIVGEVLAEEDRS